MGRDKATLSIDGRPMAAIAAAALARAGCQHVVAVGGVPGDLTAIGLTVVPDDESAVGPVRGVLGALDHFAGSGEAAPVAGVTHVAVLACDLPLLDAARLAPLVEAAAAAGAGIDVVVGTSDGRLEPTVAIWSIAAGARVAESVADGESALHRVIERLHAVRVPLDPAALLNVNRPADVPDTARRRPPGPPEYPGTS